MQRHLGAVLVLGLAPLPLAALVAGVLGLGGSSAACRPCRRCHRCPCSQPTDPLLLPLHMFWSSGARSAASRSRPPVPGVSARPVRRGLHVQVSVPRVTARSRATASTFGWRFPVLGVGDLPGPVPVVNVTLHLTSFLSSYRSGPASSSTILDSAILPVRCLE